MEPKKHIGSGVYGVVYDDKDDTVYKEMNDKHMYSIVKELFWKRDHPHLICYKHVERSNEFTRCYMEKGKCSLQTKTIELLYKESQGKYESYNDVLNAMLFDLCNGLHAIHQQQFVHNDIKPDNIIMTNDGRFVLIDFGMMSFSDIVAEYQVSSPFYRPPEYTTKEKKAILTSKGDVYSLGMTLFTLLMDEPDSNETYSYKRLKERCNELFISNHNIQLIKRMLLRDPNKRPSVSELTSRYLPSYPSRVFYSLTIPHTMEEHDRLNYISLVRNYCYDHPKRNVSYSLHRFCKVVRLFDMAIGLLGNVPDDTKRCVLESCLYMVNCMFMTEDDGVLSESSKTIMIDLLGKYNIHIGDLYTYCKTKKPHARIHESIIEEIVVHHYTLSFEDQYSMYIDRIKSVK